jgi:hypothetical protein
MDADSFGVARTVSGGRGVCAFAGRFGIETLSDALFGTRGTLDLLHDNILAAR